MKLLYLLLSCHLLIAPTLVGAAEKSTVYRLTAIPIGPQSRYQYDINGTKYETVTDLKKATQKLPHGSTLQWEPSDLIPAGVPRHPLSEEELRDITSICESRKIKFVHLLHG